VATPMGFEPMLPT